MPHNSSPVAILITVALLAGNALAEQDSPAHHEHGHGFAKDVEALHAVLAPLWHAPSGKDRARRVCAQIDRLETLANEIRSTDAKALVISLNALKAQCKAQPNDIDAAFSNVHDAFHHVAEPKRK